MAQHPPWLRFQAYVVGMPKTGSTSLATIFGNYRSGHEWQLRELLECALKRQRDGLTDDAFLRSAGTRLLQPSLEMDSTTSHYLYVDVLGRQFPGAVFFHTVRDVRSWVSSLLDMVLRKRLARRYAPMPYTIWGVDYLAMLTDGAYDLDPAGCGDDSSSLIPLMRYWGQHMHTMPARLPAGRSLAIRTHDIQHRLPEIAALAGVPASTLRTDLAHANQAPLRLDRFSAFDSEALRAAYDAHCADIMAELFPEEHAAWRAHCAQPCRKQALQKDWDGYLNAVDHWVADAVKRYGPGVAR